MIRSRFNLRPAQGLAFTKPSLTQSQFAKDTDVNVLVRRYLAGDMSVISRRAPITVDCSEAPDSFHDALNVAKSADFVWNSLPDNVRRTFKSYQDFLDCYDAVKAQQAEDEAAAAFKAVIPDKTVTADAASPVTPDESVPAATT